MKIVVFSPWVFSSSYYSAKFCNALSKLDLEIYLATPKNFMTGLLTKKVKRIFWPFIVEESFRVRDLIFAVSQAIYLLRGIRYLQPDWVHILWLHPIPLLIFPFIKTLRFAYTVHDPLLHSGEAGFFRKWIQTKIIQKSKILFVHGEGNKNNVQKEY